MSQADPGGVPLREYIERILEERRHRYDVELTGIRDTIGSLAASVQAGMVAQDKAVSAALAANDRAVEKAEANAEKWRENANEWRGAMSDRERNLMPRTESERMNKTLVDTVEQLNKTMSEKIGELRTWGSEGYGKHAGISQVWGIIAVAVPILVAVVALVVAIVK